MAFGCTVAELQDRMGSREFSEWQAFFTLEPLPEARADYRAALVAMVTAKSLGAAKDLDLADFVLKFEHESDEDRANRLRSQFEGIAAMFAGRGAGGDAS